MSYGEFPVEATPVPPVDNQIFIKQSQVIWIKIGLMWMVPLLLLGGCVVLLLSRKRR